MQGQGRTGRDHRSRRRRPVRSRQGSILDGLLGPGPRWCRSLDRDRGLGCDALLRAPPRTPDEPTSASSSQSPRPPRRSSRPANSTVDPPRIGTIFGTGVGGIHTLEEQIAIRLEKGDRRVSPFLVPMMMANAPGAAVSMRFGLQGPNETIVTACAAGTHAIDVCGPLDHVGPRRRRRVRRHRARRPRRPRSPASAT